MEGFIGVLIIIAIIAVVFIVSWYIEKRRTEAMQAVAQSLGFTFDKECDAYVRSIGAFNLFSQGRSRRGWNLMSGVTDQTEVAVFDYRYVTGSGKHSHTWVQSVLFFRSESLNLPGFTLRPEGFFDKIGGVFGYQDIDFPSHPGFSGAYLLKSNDEAAVRSVFTPSVLSYFETRHKLHVEAKGNSMIVYRQSKRVAPKDIRAFLEEGFGLFGVMKS